MGQQETRGEQFSMEKETAFLKGLLNIIQGNIVLLAFQYIVPLSLNNISNKNPCPVDKFLKM